LNEPPQISSLPTEPPALFRSTDGETAGYYELESQERRVSAFVITEHSIPVGIWYRGLTLYVHAFKGVWEIPDDTVSTVWMELAGRGVATSKVALDTLLAGYYSAAFSAIRHMMETFIQCHYLSVKPDEVSKWAGALPESGEEPETPGCGRMITEIKQLLLNAPETDFRNVAFWDELRSRWLYMSKGPHPTRLGLDQVRPNGGDPTYHYGAIYLESLSLVGFYNGLVALRLLLLVSYTGGSVPVANQQAFEDWNRRFEEWGSTLSTSIISVPVKANRKHFGRGMETETSA